MKEKSRGNIWNGQHFFVPAACNADQILDIDVCKPCGAKEVPNDDQTECERTYNK